jgi:hypothetical protein
MLQAYIDGSGTGDPERLVLAGYVAPAENWARFSDDWQGLLSMRRLPLEYFKMKDMTVSEIRREHCEYFYRAIERHVTMALICVVSTSDLRRVIGSIDWAKYPNLDPKGLDNPYPFAVNALVNVFAQNQAEASLTEPVDFIFDNEAEKGLIVEAWEHMRLTTSQYVRRFMGNTPVYRDDKRVLPLQAADLLAWWANKWETDNTAPTEEAMKFWWPRKRSILTLHMAFREADFRKELEYRLRPEVMASSIAAREMGDPAKVLEAVESCTWLKNAWGAEFLTEDRFAPNTNSKLVTNLRSAPINAKTEVGYSDPEFFMGADGLIYSKM